MAAPWVDDSVILAAIARKLAKAPADLPSYCTDIARKANDDAVADISTIMLGLGYTPAQLDQWDFVAVYAERLACYFAFNSPPLSESGVTAEKALDCRDQLRLMTSIIIGGTAVSPDVGASAVGGVADGTLSGPADELAAVDWFD